MSHPEPTEPVFHNCADISITALSVARPGLTDDATLYAMTAADVYNPYPYTLSSIDIQNGVITPIQELGYVYKRQGTQMYTDDGMLAFSSTGEVFFYGGTLSDNGTRIDGTIFNYNQFFGIYASDMQPSR